MIETILSEDGPVVKTIASPTRAVVIKSEESGYTAALVKTGGGGTPKRVDHGLGYLLSRVALRELNALRPMLREAKQRGTDIRAALDAAAGTHQIVARLRREGLDDDTWSAVDVLSADQKNLMLTLAAKLVYREWLRDPDPTFPPLPKPSMIVRRKSLRGAYDALFGKTTKR